MTLSTTSGRGVRKSDEAISGLKKISGAKNRSYPTSTLYFCTYVRNLQLIAQMKRPRRTFPVTECSPS